MNLPITRGRKFKQALAGARAIFLRDGFDGASVDDIARAGGISKATLYSYFPDKRVMFIEVFRAELAANTHDGLLRLEADLRPAEFLPAVARFLCGLMRDELNIRVMRLSAGEAARFPMLAQESYNAGPVAIRDHLVGYLKRQVDQGELDIEDIVLAAEQFVELCRASALDRALFLGPQAVDPRRQELVARAAVDMFLQFYGAPDEEGAGSTSVARAHRGASPAQRQQAS